MELFGGRSGDPKTKKYPCLPIFGGGVRGGADKKLKGYFFVLGASVSE